MRGGTPVTTELFDSFGHDSGSWWIYLLIAMLAAADITVLVPADAVIIAAVVLALHGPLLVPVIAAAAVAGAVTGDNLLYVLGRRAGPLMVDRLFRSERSKRRLARAREQMNRHHRLLIVAGRFVPVGRTATMLAAGLLHVPWCRFIVPEVVAVLLWAAYTVLTPVAFGDAVPGWGALLLSFGVALLLAGAAELARRLVELRRREAGPRPGGRSRASGYAVEVSDDQDDARGARETDQDAEPTMTAPPGERPDAGASELQPGGRADSPDVLDTEAEQGPDEPGAPSPS